MWALAFRLSAHRFMVHPAFPPCVVISLDFELRWGVHDVYGRDFSRFRESLEGGRDVVPALLERFAARGLHATWATVGALGCTGWEDYFSRAPQPPDYAKPGLRVDPRYAELDPAGELHFAPDLVRAIAATAGQELGMHTFSHLYLRESGITAADVAADLAAARALFEERYGVRPTSLVFPRNQCAFIDVVRASGIRMWRGNPGPWYYEREDSESHGSLVRALKLLDGINPLRRLAAPVSGDMTRASMFLRLNLPRPLWRSHIARIRGELGSLAPDDVFHLWFHPHNVGAATAERLSRLDTVLDMIAEHRQRGEIVSSSMGELVTRKPVAAGIRAPDGSTEGPG